MGTNKMQCCVAAEECSFVKEVIDSLNKFLAFMTPDYFGSRVVANIMIPTEANLKEIKTLTLEGTMMAYYIMAFKEAFPTNPDSLQVTKINQIWQAMGYPQNIIPI